MTQLRDVTEASISTRILGPDPTTFEAYRVHPIVNPTKFWEGVGDLYIYGVICKHLSHFTTRENRHHQRRFPKLKYMQMRWRTPLEELTALPQLNLGSEGRGIKDRRTGRGERREREGRGKEKGENGKEGRRGREREELEWTRPSSGENRRPWDVTCHMGLYTLTQCYLPQVNAPRPNHSPQASTRFTYYGGGWKAELTLWLVYRCSQYLLRRGMEG